MASVHCKQDTLRLRSCLEHHGTRASPVAVHLQADRVVGSGVFALVHTAGSHLLLRGEGCGDTGHTL